MKNEMNSPIFWTLLTCKEWNLHIAATTEGLCYVGSNHQSFEEMASWANVRFSNSIQKPSSVRAVGAGHCHVERRYTASV
ncbi:hypothetical protein PASE110613_04720 [Paenibacillus sediminis]|uniref:Uncharacterized protein n=1 Tax=Paenibacillus sediminis TaxID=664909 RepID=A0ABS4H0M0_9BACL|nr:hypothetical protein [Paenibacillus sediminis]